jgi:glycosyltransferase involved in cell wall biosynthesis
VRIEGEVPHDRISTYYAAADILAFPCRDDRPWVVLVEAQMHGLPVLTMRTSRAETLVVDGKGGLLAEDLGIFEKNLSMLIDDDQYRLMLGAAARQHAATDLTIERWVRQLATLLGGSAEE